jgi:DNA-binding NarL/FixJ family response regulator
VDLLLEGLVLADGWSDAAYTSMFLGQLAQIAFETHCYELATTLTVSAAIYSGASGVYLESNAHFSLLQAELSPEAFVMASEQGTRLTISEIRSACLSGFIHAHSRPAEPVAPFEIVELSARELEVLRGVAAGANTKSIAILLGVSASTVRFHVESIFRKLGCHTRAEAVLVAAEHGWLSVIDNADFLHT